MRNLGAGFYKSIGIALSTIGMIMIISAIAIYFIPEQEVDEVKLKKGLMGVCKTIVEDEGFKAVTTGNSVKLKKRGIGRYKAKIYATSLVISRCNGFKMTSFCMGSKCEDDAGKPLTGVVATLTYDKKAALGVDLLEKFKNN